jgi:hypothetical protein
MICTSLEEEEMKKVNLYLIFVLLLGCLCILNTPAMAEDPNMTGDNGGNQSSYNQLTNWSDGLAPSAGKTYFTNGYLMRSPVAAPGGAYLTGNQTFLGDSLTIGRGNNPVGTPGYSSYAFNTNGAVNNNSLLAKASGLNMIVNNLILDAGNVRDGLGDADNCHLSGNIYVTANGGGFLSQCSNYIDSVISGPGPIYIGDNGSGGAARVVYLTSSASTYAGNIIMAPGTSGNQNRSRLNFPDNSLMNFVIGASGVNNSISGNGIATFAGDFNFDLTGASTNLNDSWTIVSTTTKTFNDATFTVKDFINLGGGRWRKFIDETNCYTFGEISGTLVVVPEPATMVLLGLGSLALLRRRKA